jgi:hypothetical protein
MLRIKKVLKSREAWKQKASLRAEALREARKTKKRHLYTIAHLKLKNKQLQQELMNKKNNNT